MTILYDYTLWLYIKTIHYDYTLWLYIMTIHYDYTLWLYISSIEVIGYNNEHKLVYIYCNIIIVAINHI